MSDGRDEQSYFDSLVTEATGLLTGEEVLLAAIDGEQTDFVRFNGGDVRQAGTVEQCRVSIDLVEGRRHVSGSTQLTGEGDIDRRRVEHLVQTLREQRGAVAEDPYLLYNTEPSSTERVESGAIPGPHDALGDLRAAGAGKDLVGIYAAGTTFRGFANSLGQRNWFQSSTFNLDWCFYLRDDKAAKNLYAGFDWDDSAFDTKVARSTRQLDALRRDPIELPPGDYRTYLAPPAMEELVSLWGHYGAFGRRAHETRQTPLLRMAAGEARMAPTVTISEDTANGVAPNFQSEGFLRPDRVVLVEHGACADTLVSPRTALEFGATTNGATDGEYPESLSIAPGTLPTEHIDDELGTGLYVGNLWYTNFSDRMACRTTGMTRFATFWMEDGEIVAPIGVLRFDDTAFHLLGDRLVGLTDTAEVLLDASSYGQRSTASATMPGALVDGMRFVL